MTCAEATAQRGEYRHAELSQVHHLFSLATKGLDPVNRSGPDFISELYRRISVVNEDPFETSFLFHRFSVAVQRVFAVSFANSSGHGLNDYAG
jgi:hypothetical protein